MFLKQQQQRQQQQQQQKQMAVKRLNACAAHNYCHQREWDAFNSSDAFNASAKCHHKKLSKRFRLKKLQRLWDMKKFKHK